MDSEYDIVIVGAGSAGCAAAFRLAQAGIGKIAVLEAGYSNRVPQVKIPFGLVWMRGSKRDWKFESTRQTELDGRRIAVTRGKMLGGSSSINSMVWFRGRRDDFDNWDVPGWRFDEVEPAFESVESLLKPQRIETPHPISEIYGRALGNNSDAPPSPERESAGIFHVNLHNGERWSAADALLQPARKTGMVDVITQANVDRLELEDGSARRVRLTDGRVFTARFGVVLSAGSIASPAILMRSGIGPAQKLKSLGIDPIVDSKNIGSNLHDHPAVGLHYQGPRSGYGMELAQLPHWGLAPFNWLLRRKGRFASQTVEAGAFFRAAPVGDDGDDRPDCQSHFIPFMVGYKGHFITWGAGYSADVNICRPYSRGQLNLRSANPLEQPDVDFGLLTDRRDMETLKHGVQRLRRLMAGADLGKYQAQEVYPGDDVQSDEAIEQFVRDRCATAYHPVGTVRMGVDAAAPLTPELAVRGVDGLWVADASIMPAVTTANTNAPSMMIGYRAGEILAAKARNLK